MSPHLDTPSTLFLSFEGVEGAGKSTQIALLRDALQARGLQVVVTREPGGEPTAEAIREVVLRSTEPVTPEAELLLFMAARAQVVARVIRPALESGATVLCDRYIDSSVAYQGYARGQDLEIVRKLNRLATGGLAPDATILLDLDPAVGLRRQEDANRMEAEDVAFHRRVREGYLAEAAREPARFHVVDAAQPAPQIHRAIIAAVDGLLCTAGAESKRSVQP